MADSTLEASPLYNQDLAPVPAERRTWTTWNFAALWVGMAVCIPTYTLAAGMISQGMSWAQALATVALGNLVVLAPMIANAHAGTRYGIPFPVLLRASFGTRGANVPALLRAFVACGWFGIQTWIGGAAIYSLAAVLFGFSPAGAGDHLPGLGISAGQLACFLLFWALNLYFVLRGLDSIKGLEAFAAPVLLAVGVGLLVWAAWAGGGFGRILSAETLAEVRGGLATDFDFWRVFWPNLTAMVGFWATLSLNIPDFSRFARSQRDQALGQLVALPATMTLFAFLGIAVTCASVVVFGEAIWDPVVLLGRFESPVVVVVALLALTLATLSTNIAANVVSPANDFSNLAPRRIDFRRGGIITAVVGVAILPWRLYNDLGNYVFTWLIGGSALLGSVAGVMLVDYFLLRRRKLDVEALYQPHGAYSYGGSGWNPRALVAVLLGILPNVPGFLAQATAGAIPTSPFWASLYTYAWFVSLAVAGLVYWVLGVPGLRAEGRRIAGLGLLAALALATGSALAAAEPPAEPRAEPPAGQPAETVVFLVRHAEKDTAVKENPPLTPAGGARAAALAGLLRDAGLTHVWSTRTLRTESTARPSAEAAGLELEWYAGGELEAFAATLRSTPGRHLVVGHSDTTPELVRLLGGEPGAPIHEPTEYDRLYLLTLGADGRATTVLLRQGEQPGKGPENA